MRAGPEMGFAIGRWKAAIEIPPLRPRMGHIGTRPLKVLLAPQPLGSYARQVALAAGIPDGHLQIIERAGHNAHDERPTEVLAAITAFIAADAAVPNPPAENA